MFVSRTTPTTSAVVPSSQPNRTCLPTALLPGHNLLARFWLTRTTGGEDAVSVTLKSRPSSNGICMVDKKPAEITPKVAVKRSEEHTSELQSRLQLVCRLLL